MAGRISHAIGRSSGEKSRQAADPAGRRRTPGPGGRRLAAAGMGRLDHRGLARGLGWFSLALGVAQMAAPRALARAIGASEDDETAVILRGVGLREIASGVGILSAAQPSGGVWARALGDLMDLALLGIAAGGRGSSRGRLAGAAAAVAGVTVLDLFCGQGLSRGGPGEGAGTGAAGAALPDRIHLVETVTINRPPEDVYRFWRDVEGLSQVLSHVERIDATGERQTHWRVKGPAGIAVEWDADITEDEPGELLAWRTREGADIDHTGAVRLAPGPAGRGTVVTVELRYDPPAGRAGHAVARLFGRDPGHEIRHDLRLVKQVLETGEITRSDASIHPGLHPGQPPASGGAAP